MSIFLWSLELIYKLTLLQVDVLLVGSSVRRVKLSPFLKADFHPTGKSHMIAFTEFIHKMD
jgi:hypothetical protein